MRSARCALAALVLPCFVLSVRGDEPKEAAGELRYDGKPFSYWKQYLKTELKAERRIDAVRAMAAFGGRGHAEEATQAIVDLVKEYREQDLYGSGFQSEATLEQKLLAEVDATVARIGKICAPVLLRNLSDQRGRLFAMHVLIGSSVPALPVPESVTLQLVTLALGKSDDARNVAVMCLASLLEDDAQSKSLLMVVSGQDKRGQFVDALYKVHQEEWNWRNCFTTARNYREDACLVLGKLAPLPRKVIRTLVKSRLDGSAAAKKALDNLKPDIADVLPILVNGVAVEETRNAAVEYLGEIGPMARSAIPAILQIIDSETRIAGSGRERVIASRELQEAKVAIIETLEKLKPSKKEAAPTLRAILEKRSDMPELQVRALRLFRNVGGDTGTVVPALMQIMDENIERTSRQFGWPVQKTIEEEIVEAFEELGPRAVRTVPALIKGIQTAKKNQPRLRLRIVAAWKAMGPAAFDALPLLNMLANDSVEPEPLRQAAREAIAAISKK